MLTDELFATIRSGILSKLGNNLSKDLLYHNLQHTVDVELQAERIANSEKMCSQHDLLVLKIACLYHDSGFLFSYEDHEVAGCKLVKEHLPSFGITTKELKTICGLIMATRIPQTPLSKLEEIICDADLDYLGRADFFTISNNLFLELKANNFSGSENDWNLIQIKFFNQHKYFTDTNKKLREKQKLTHLAMIEAASENVEMSR